MRVSRKNITLSIFLKVISNKIFRIFLIYPITFILNANLIMSKKIRKFWNFLGNISNISFTIQPILNSNFCKFLIPKIESILRDAILTNFFEKCISLAHYLLIIAFDFGKLSIRTRQNIIQIFTAHRRRKIQNIHIKWRHINRSKRQFFKIFWFGNFFSLH